MAKKAKFLPWLYFNKKWIKTSLHVRPYNGFLVSVSSYLLPCKKDCDSLNQRNDLITNRPRIDTWQIEEADVKNVNLTKKRHWNFTLLSLEVHILPWFVCLIVWTLSRSKESIYQLTKDSASCPGLVLMEMPPSRKSWKQNIHSHLLVQIKWKTT